MMSEINQRQIDWTLGTITHQGTCLRVEPKLMQVLQVLYSAEGQLITQDELLDLAWPGTVVSPNTVQRSIGQLRKLLGDSGSQQQVIQTLPKRGYRLVSAKHHNGDPLPHPKGRAPAFTWVAGSVAFLLMCLFIYQNTAGEPQQVTASIIGPFDGASTHQHSLMLSQDQQHIAYFSQQDHGHQLTVKHLTTESIQDIKLVSSPGRGLSFSMNGKGVLYSEVNKIDGVKCSQLKTTHVETGLNLNHGQCESGFYDYPLWVNSQELLYIWRQKDRTSSLRLHNMVTDDWINLTPQFSQIQSFAYQTNTHTLAVIADSQSLLTGPLENQQWTQIDRYILPFNWQNEARLSWQPDGTLLMPNQNRVHRLKNGRFVSEIQLEKTAQTHHVQFYAPQKRLLVESEYSDWDIHLQTEQGHNTTVGKSGFQERDGRFIPGTQDVSFLSDRSGQMQIWRQTREVSQQISQSPSDIRSYLWSSDGRDLYYVNQQGLWVISSNQRAVKIPTPFTANTLFQYTESGLLMAVSFGEREQLISLTPEDGKWVTELHRHTHWAQKIAPSTVITNDGRGRLQKYIEQKQTPITGLRDFIIQPYYFVSGQHVYVQDKNFNLWQYRPDNESAKVVDHYTKQSVFMTDYQPETKKLLTENFIYRQQQSLWMKINL